MPEAAAPITVAPEDRYNQELVQQVHPPDWVNPVPEGRYHMVVIGAGSAGLVTAAGSAGLGARVAIVERHLMGGDCLVTGCVPSKGLIRAARAVHDVREAGRFGVEVPDGVAVDFPRMMERMRRIRAGISHHDSAERFRDLGVDVFLGDARFIGPDTVQVGDQTLRFRRACIATGGRAAELPIPGLAEAGYLTNETVFNLTRLPARLAVIGAGPIGCELAQSFQRFGSQVHLLEIAPQILIREDGDAARIVQEALVADGVDLQLDVKIQRIETTGSGKQLVFERGEETHSLKVDEILLGVGRTPNVEGLGLEAAGVAFDKTGVEVNERLQTSNKRIFAAGDICTRYKFTHMADAMARIVIGNALFYGRSKGSGLTVPWVTYTDPEVAHVGYYEEEAREAGFKVETLEHDLSELDRARLDGDGGLVKIHLKAGSDRILGATVVARHAGEMLGEVSVAMVNRVGLKGIGRTIHPYPTQAEVFKRIADTYNRGRLTPFVKKLFRWWFALTG